MSLSPEERARLEAVERRLAEVDSKGRRKEARGRYLLASVVAFAFLVAPLTVLGASQSSDDGPKAEAAGNARGEAVQIQVRNRSTAETGLINSGDGFALRFSNTKIGGGGGLISGCRTVATGDACQAGINLRQGPAFFFQSQQGSLGGQIQVNGPNARPFTTNATNVATGLNADRVDGQNGPFLSDAANSVNTNNIADNAVTTAKIADDAVTTEKIANDAVTTAKIANGNVTGPDLAGIASRTNSDTLANNQRAAVAVACQGNEQILSGGGFFTGATNPGRDVIATFRAGNGWVVIGENTSGADQTLNVQANCLSG